jgi:hypothetical protein
MYVYTISGTFLTPTPKRAASFLAHTARSPCMRTMHGAAAPYVNTIVLTTSFACTPHCLQRQKKGGGRGGEGGWQRERDREGKREGGREGEGVGGGGERERNSRRRKELSFQNFYSLCCLAAEVAEKHVFGSSSAGTQLTCFAGTHGEESWLFRISCLANDSHKDSFSCFSYTEYCTCVCVCVCVVYVCACHI